MGKGLEAFALTFAEAEAFRFVGGELHASHLTGVSFTATAVVAHGLVGGTFSVLQGGSFGSGFLAAGVSELATPYILKSTQGSLGLGAIETAIIGGTASALGGGKFGNGAITGAFGYLFNAALHQKDHVSCTGDPGCDENLTRHLTANEAAAGQQEYSAYGRGLDTSSVTVAFDWIFGDYAITPGNTIHFPSEYSDCADFITCGGENVSGWFIHELGHVWQFQNGISPVLGRVFSFDFLNSGSYLDKQEYKSIITPSSLDTEQQADWHRWHFMCENYPKC